MKRALMIILWIMVVLAISSCKEESHVVSEVVPLQDTKALEQQMENEKHPVDEVEKDQNDMNKEEKKLVLAPPELTYKPNLMHARTFEIPLEGDNLRVPLYQDSLYIFIQFDEVIHPSSAESKVTLLSEHPFKTDVGEQFIQLWISEVKVGDQLKIQVLPGIEGINGHRLMEEHSVSMEVVEAPKAKFTLTGVDGGVMEYGYYDIFPAIGGEEEQLTDEPKQLHINFTQPVDQKSVETVIQESFDNNAAYTMDWTSDKQLSIELEAFDQMGTYSLQLQKAKDKSGYPVANSFYFTVYPANELIEYDMKTQQSQKIKTFHNKRYDVNVHPFLENYLLLADQNENYLYNFDEDVIKPLDKQWQFPRYLAMSPWMTEVEWVDPQKAIYIQSDQQVVTYAFEEGQLEILLDYKDFALFDDTRIISLQVSPDSSKYAIATVGPSNEDQEYAVQVFTMDGSLVYETTDIESLRVLWAAGEFFTINLDWLNEKELVIETGSREKTDIVKLDIEDKSKEIMAEHARNPISFPDQEKVLIQRMLDSGNVEHYIHSKDKRILIQHEKILNITNAMMINENEMIMNIDRHEIARYHLESGVLTPIGGGKMVGVSKDGTKLYYWTNQDFLLPIS